MNKLTILSFFALSLFACQNDQADSSQKVNEAEVAESKPVNREGTPSIEGTWVRSYQINDETLEVGFTLNEDHSVSIIKLRDDYSKYWKLANKDSLQFYYRNRVTNDTLISKNYYIERLGHTEMVLIPHNARKNYKEYYTRK